MLKIASLKFKIVFKFISFISILIFWTSIELPAQEFLGLKDIINGSYNVPGSTPSAGIRPEVLDANSLGGSLKATVNLKRNATSFCPGNYVFAWKFSKPVDRILLGETIEVNYTSSLTGQLCPSAQGKMIVTNSNGASPEYKQTGITRVGGFSTQNVRWVNAGNTVQSNTTSIKLINTSSQYATIKLNFEISGILGSERMHFEVVYLFEKGYERELNCDPDLVCHNLYSVGVLVGFAEYGASKNDNPQFLAEQLDGAIIHANASRCVPTDGLRKMSAKLKGSSGSLQLHGEISRLRVEIAEFVERNCNCCH